MILYERITFLLVSGMLGLFLVALILGAWGVALTLHPGLDSKILRGVHAAIALAKVSFRRLREAYRSVHNRWTPAAQ